ncbi:MAG: hypothetical protein RI883_2649 [Bacteroidota bacterium]|jgi:hypothetical protein
MQVPSLILPITVACHVVTQQLKVRPGKVVFANLVLLRLLILSLIFFLLVKVVLQINFLAQMV